MVSDSRNRKSSETDATQDSGYYTSRTDEMPTIEEWVAEKDQFRVVAIGHTRPFPLVSQKSSNTNLGDYHREHVAPHLSKILANHKIPWNSIELNTRLSLGSINRSKQKSGHGIESLLISTTSENTRRWKAAATQILGIYGQGGWLATDIEVEIFNPLRMTWNRSHALGENDKVVSAFNLLRPAIERKVRSLCGSAWSSIAFHNRTSMCSNTGPEKPTVIIFCHPGSQCDFKSVDEYLDDLLKTTDVELFHEIQVGSVREAWSVTDKGKGKYSVPPQTPPNGASISLEQDLEGAGTLGGWLMLNFPKSPPVKVAVTCDHLINKSTAPTEGLNLSQAKQNEPLLIVYPAALDRNATIKHLKSLTSRPGCADSDKENLRKCGQIFSKPPIGQVIAASGNRCNPDGRRMDWALIQVPGNTSRNNPPPHDTLNDQSLKAFNELNLGSYKKITEDSVVRQFGSMSKGSWVVKRGRTSGTTTAIVNGMTRTVKWDRESSELVSREVEVYGMTDDFAFSGDSGSFVCDHNGALVGLLIGSETCAGSFGCGFVTPIAEIQADVKKKTGGFLSLDP
ncbi:hypothetical protein MMC31_005389 [Peltigera leucophlebia]|nr:hypothetical protein [Peltigera leucophlebia]